MKHLKAVKELCTGCGICEMVCSLGHTGDVNPIRARLGVMETEDEWRYPVICRHCKRPKCEEACPVPGAMRQDAKTGAVVLDVEKCDRCGACREACPFDAVFQGPDGEVLKCDLCGGEPSCVEYCFPRPPSNFPHMPSTEQSCLRYEERSGEG
jgi:Fe-S-cluster-containing hydrogenase component 2